MRFSLGPGEARRWASFYVATGGPSVSLRHLKTSRLSFACSAKIWFSFRDGNGRAGVIGAYCAHRRANLCLGDVERDGVRCRYHGWLYDTKRQGRADSRRACRQSAQETRYSLASVSRRRIRRFDLRVFRTAARAAGAALQFSRRRRRCLHHHPGVSKLQLAAVRRERHGSGSSELHSRRRMAGHHEHRAGIGIPRNRMGHGVQSVSKDQRARRCSITASIIC